MEGKGRASGLPEWRKDELGKFWKPRKKQMCAVLRGLVAESTVQLYRKMCRNLDWKKIKGRAISSQQRSPECTARTVRKREVWRQEECEAQLGWPCHLPRTGPCHTQGWLALS